MGFMKPCWRWLQGIFGKIVSETICDYSNYYFVSKYSKVFQIVFTSAIKTDIGEVS